MFEKLIKELDDEFLDTSYQQELYKLYHVILNRGYKTSYYHNKNTNKSLNPMSFIIDLKEYSSFLEDEGYSKEEVKSMTLESFISSLKEDFLAKVAILDYFGLKDEILKKRSFKSRCNSHLMYARLMAVKKANGEKKDLKESYNLFPEEFKEKYGLNDSEVCQQYPLTTARYERLKAIHQLQNLKAKKRRDYESSKKIIVNIKDEKK